MRRSRGITFHGVLRKRCLGLRVTPRKGLKNELPFSCNLEHSVIISMTFSKAILL